MAETIFFPKERRGYDKKQVDDYISKLSLAYQTIYDEHQALLVKYESISEDYKKIEAQEKNRSGADLIAKVLLDAEMLAQKIIDSANNEADAIRAEAQKVFVDVERKTTEAARISAWAREKFEYAHGLMEQTTKNLQDFAVYGETDAENYMIG